MLIFKYDLDYFDVDEVQQMYDNLSKKITNETVIAIPKHCELYRLEDSKKDFEYIFKGE